MDSPDFQIVERRFDVPFRKRNLHAGYIIFRAGELHVCVHPQVASRVREYASRALPRETGGLLAGRILRDDEGPYVVLTGMAVAPPGAGDVSRFNLSPDETENLRRTLSVQDPSADVVGWWHSHSAPSHYSQTDRGNQAIWADPRHVGLLVFAEGTPWASLYVGPKCHGPFQPDEPVRGRQSGGGPGGGREAPPLVTGDRAVAHVSWAAWISRRVVSTAVIVLVALLAGALATSLLTRGSVTIQKQSGRYLAWTCVVAATNLVTCQVTSGSPVKWFLDGSFIASGPSVTFPLHSGGENIVRVVVKGPAGSYGGEQPLEPLAGRGGG